MFKLNDRDRAIIEALRSAKAAAIAADPGEDQDGGTCNLDSVVVKFPPHTRHERVAEIARKSGVPISDPLSGRWKGYRFITVGSRGQANRRSVMVEAAGKALNTVADDIGLEVRMWYQAD